MSTPMQPLLHDALLVLRAPTQAWSAADGSMGSSPIEGFYFSDIRIVSHQAVRIGGQAPEPIANSTPSADRAVFVGLARHLDDAVPDPGVRVEHTRAASSTGIEESLTVSSRLPIPIHTELRVELRLDQTPIDDIKGGKPSLSQPAAESVPEGGVRWSGSGVSTTLASPDADVSVTSTGAIVIRADLVIPAVGSTTIHWSLNSNDAIATVQGATAEVPWASPVLRSGDDRLRRWLKQALGDLDSLRMAMANSPDQTFLAAGAPWFLTLFGRDSLWSARFMLPLGTRLAADTLRTLAGLQGREVSDDTAEEPGKILHELRRQTTAIPGTPVVLPPLYYGTVDATALWVCLLHDAWRWGLAEDEVLALMPNLVDALCWMRDFGDSDGDGLLEYVDRSGHGLANQGWKDSGDSVQWRDGTLSEGPIALCEVQAYAFEAATKGADLLDHFGFDGAEEWRAWAARLQSEFNRRFWIEDAAGPYPAIALDANKRPVDTVTSNIGHLLGTGLLDVRAGHVRRWPTGFLRTQLRIRTTDYVHSVGRLLAAELPRGLRLDS